MKSTGKSPTNLRGLALVTFLACVFVWQTFPALIGMMLFILLVRVLRIDWRYLAGIGGFMVFISVFTYWFNHHTEDYIATGWQINALWWRLGMLSHVDDAMRLSFSEGLFYVMSVPIPMVGIMALMELIPASAHEGQLKALQRGNASGSNRLSQKSSSSLERTLQRISDAEHDGTVLGVSASSGKPVVMPDDNVNQLALVLGTTGGGKTVTLRRFYRRAMLAGYPLIIVDGKPTKESTGWIAQQAKAAGKPF